jgi:hypothetical protein
MGPEERPDGGVAAAAEAEDFRLLMLSLEAEAFFWAGGTVGSYKDWLQLGTVEKAAFVDAGKRVAAQKAIWSGLASMGPVAAAEIAEQFGDQGDMKCRVAVSQLCEIIAGELKRKAKEAGA